MSIWLQNFASIEPRTSLVKFDHLAEKSEKDSISNLSTKEVTAVRVDRRCRTGVEVVVSSVLCATKKGFDVPSEQRLIEALRRLRPKLGPTLHIFAWIIVVRILRLAKKKTRLLLT